jgi:hypothetical protein
VGRTGNQSLLRGAICLVFGLLGPVPLSADPPVVVGGRLFRIAITRDCRGWLEPCDCKEGVLGGFPRRATVLGDLKPDLLLDAGDLVSQASPYDLLKLRFMLALNGRLGYGAVNAGRREAEFSRAELEGLAAESPVPLISANLADEAGKPVLPGHVILTRGGRRIAILGLVTPEATCGAGLRILDPAGVLRSELGAVRVDAVVILLVALPAAELPRSLAAVPGVDLVLGGLVPKGSEKLEAIEGVPCFLVQGKGQYLADVELREEGGRLVPASGRRILLGPEIAADPEIEQRIRAFELSVKDLDLLGKSVGHGPFIGARACAACHGEAWAAWGKTPHARALSALRPEKGLYDPLCLARHATARGTGGYSSAERTPEFAGVGCECCHGPCRGHAASEVFIAADGRGSNGYRLRPWKLEIQKMADETRLPIHVCHFPPVTSEWDKAEHRQCSFITSNWRGQPLQDNETFVQLISRTTTARGLTV